MKIAYFSHLNLGPDSGVYKKILSQVNVWNSAGHHVRLFVVTRSTEVQQGLQNYYGHLRSALFLETYSRSALKTWPFLDARLQAFARAITGIVTWRPDVVYMREDFFYPPFKELFSSVKVVMEINTNDLAEIWLHSKTQWMYHAITRRFLIGRASGLVFMTNELAHLRSFANFHKPYEVVSNGVDLRNYEVTNAESDVVRLVFLGQDGCPWHGVDKVMIIAKNNPDWQIDVIGPTSSKSLGYVPPNVRFHGVLSQREYDGIMHRATCAIGTLALHRNGMNEACPLKTREYLAYGLPVIIGYQDTDFPSGAPFLLQLPNSEDNVANNMESIRRFVSNWKGRRVEHREISFLDIEFKERQRLRFLQEIVAGRGEIGE